MSNVDQHQKTIEEHSSANIDEYVQLSTFKEDLAEVSVQLDRQASPNAD